MNDVMEREEFLDETADDIVDGDLVFDEDAYDDEVALVGELFNEFVHKTDQLIAKFVHEFQLQFFLIHFCIETGLFLD